MKIVVFLATIFNLSRSSSIPDYVSIKFNYGKPAYHLWSPSDRNIFQAFLLCCPAENATKYPMFFLDPQKKKRILGNFNLDRLSNELEIWVEFLHFDICYGYPRRIEFAGREITYYSIMPIPKDIKGDKSKQGWKFLIAAAMEDLGFRHFRNFRIQIVDGKTPYSAYRGIGNTVLFQEDKVRILIIPLTGLYEQVIPMPILLAYQSHPLLYGGWEIKDAPPSPSSSLVTETTASPEAEGPHSFDENLR